MLRPKKKNNQKKKVLLVIDMLRDFLEQDGALFCGERARRIIPFVQHQIDVFHQSGDLVIFICDAHRRNDLEFTLFPPHSIKGTRGAQIVPELRVGPKDIIIPKTRYSAFYGTRLSALLKQKRITEAYVVGVCTSICVMDTVGDLRNRDYPVFVFRQGVADFDPKAHRFALQRMEKIYGAKLI
jgi:nicotinamidase/pyrazinamidase